MRLSTKLLLSSLPLFVFCMFINHAALSASANWVVTIKTKQIEKCLEYPDSKLKPLVKASITFEQGVIEPDEQELEMRKHGLAPDVDVPPTAYEDIFYSNLHILGLKRYREIQVKEGTPGTIRVLPCSSQLRQEEANAAANATVRVYLDLFLHKAALRSISVSRESFDLYIQELQRYGFRIANVVPGGSIPALAMLSIRSEPAGRMQYMSYGY